MLKVLVTGSTGLVGSRIVELLKNDFRFILPSNLELDITNPIQAKTIIKKIDFDIFLHLAAYTNVDMAEKEKALAYKVNVEGTKNVFEVVQKRNKKFIYISTDFVFDGKTPPYFEDSTPNPISYYGQTKYEGEQVVAGKAMIVRIAYPYRCQFEKKKDFVRNIIEFLQRKQELKMVSDSLFTPTFVDDIAFGLKYLLQNYTPAIFHLVGAESLSPYEAGKTIAKSFNLDQTLIQPTTYKDYFKNKAKRPQYSVIKSKKNNFYQMRGFKDGLQTMLKELL